MQLSEIQLSLQSVEQILLTRGTSAYSRHMLNEDVEEFIVEEAQSCPRRNAIVITISLPTQEIARGWQVEAAIKDHFRYLKKKSEKKLKYTLQLGWRSLLVGFAFLVLVFMLTKIGNDLIPKGGVAVMIRESLVILGWVAMWRPADLLLYEWYPFKRDATLFGRLAESEVRVVDEARQHGAH